MKFWNCRSLVWNWKFILKIFSYKHKNENKYKQLQEIIKSDEQCYFIENHHLDYLLQLQNSSNNNNASEEKENRRQNAFSSTTSESQLLINYLTNERNNFMTWESAIQSINLPSHLFVKKFMKINKMQLKSMPVFIQCKLHSS